MFLLIKNKNIVKSRNKTIFIILCCCKGFHCSPSCFSVSNIAQTQCIPAWNRYNTPLHETDAIHPCMKQMQCTPAWNKHNAPLHETDSMHPAWNHVNYKLQNTYACKYNLLSAINFLLCSFCCCCCWNGDSFHFAAYPDPNLTIFLLWPLVSWVTSRSHCNWLLSRLNL